MVCHNLILNNERSREMVTQDQKLINLCLDKLLNIDDSKMKLTVLRVLKVYFENVSLQKCMTTIRRDKDVA